MKVVRAFQTLEGPSLLAAIKNYNTDLLNLFYGDISTAFLDIAEFANDYKL
jgi:hypothetical protein